MYHNHHTSKARSNASAHATTVAQPMTNRRCLLARAATAVLALAILWPIHQASSLAGMLTPTAASARATCNTDNKLCGDELLVFDWGGDDEPRLVPDYIKKYPKKPRWSLFTDSSEGLQKVKGGFQVDLAHVTNSDLMTWRDYLTPWDIKKITAWNDLYSFWKNAPGFEPVDGKIYGIPTFFGMSVPIYDPEKIKPGELKSLKDITDPKYKGRIGMPDLAYEAYAFCLVANGNKIPFAKISKKNVDECSIFLRALHKNVRVYWTDSASVVASFKTGELWFAQVWGDVPYTINQDRKDKKTPVVVARDMGFVLWAQAMTRLKTSKPEVEPLAYDFTNAMHGDSAAEFLVNTWSYGLANKKAMEKINPDIIKAHYLDNLESYYKKGRANIFSGLPVDVSQYLQAEWEKIKSGK